MASEPPQGGDNVNAGGSAITGAGAAPAAGRTAAAFLGRLERFWWLFLLAAACFLWSIARFDEFFDAAGAPRGIALQLAWSIDAALGIVRQWREHRLGDVARSTLLLDFFLVVFYVIGLWGACRIAARVLAERLDERLAAWMPRAPIAAGVFDVLENLAMLQLVEGSDWSAWLAAALVVAAKLKWLLLAVAGCFILFAAWAQFIRWLAGAAPEQGAGELPDQASLAEVINAELDLIVPDAARPAAPGGAPAGQAEEAPPVSDAEQAAYRRAHQADLWGLALSGGGIRSATFCLGVLQALARADRLSCFHYLSTVSGGGYIGSWLSAWISRRAGNAIQVERALQAPGRDLAEIRFLRSYSNYLTPRKGPFTVDTWTAIATYLRNLSLNLFILIGFIWALFAALMLIVFHHGSPGTWGLIAAIAACLGTVAMTLDVTCVPDPNYTVRSYLIRALRLLRAARPILRFVGLAPGLERASSMVERESRRVRSRSLSGARAFIAWLQSDAGVFASVVAPLFLISFGGAVWWYAVVSDDRGGDWVGPVLHVALLGLWFWAAAFAFANLLNERYAWIGALIQLAAATLLAVLAWRYAEGHPFDWIAASVWTLIGTTAIVIVGWSVVELASGQMRGFAKFAYEFSRYALAAILGIMVAAATVKFGSEHLLLAWYAKIVATAAIAREDLDLFRNALAVTVVPPIVLAGFGAGVVCGIGLLGNQFSDQGREWWARAGGWIMIVMVGWVVLVAVPLAVPGVLDWLEAHAVRGVNTLLGSGWALVTGVLTFFARRGSAARAPGAAVRAAAAAVPYLFAAGVVILLASGFYELAVRFDAADAGAGAAPLCGPQHGLAACIVAGMVLLGGIPAGTWMQFFVGSFFVAMLFSLCVDINRFSLHDFYRNRLVRCYLGASNRARRERPGRVTDVDPFTGFSPSDDLAMESLRANRTPYHIVNAALNIVKTDRLAWQERKAASFTFAPLYCGYALGEQEKADTRKTFRLTSRYANSVGPGSGVTLGTAMAISGAAVSPNMGQLTTPAFAALMTVLNLRLGSWMPNPGRRRPPRLPSPPVAAIYLFFELFGMTDEKSRYVYLSDGGHFENLAIYELVRRRCRLIVAVDAGADPRRSFEDLGNCIRKCRIDLGVKITLDVENLQLRSDGTSAVAHAEGEIHYDEGAPGRLIYLKPGNCPQSEARAQLRSYRLLHQDFPHQPTTDQWFDESQFESYRALGELIAERAIRELPGRAGN